MQKIVLLLFAFAYMMAVVLFFGLLSALPTYWLWNGLVPELFGLKAVTFLQAWGLNILFGLLFKSTSVSSS